MIQVGFNGIVSDLKSEAYHANFKELPALGSSQIKVAGNTLAKFKAVVLDNLVKREVKSAFDLGTCAHSVILEQTTEPFVKGPLVSSKAVKEWKEFEKATRDSGKIPLTPEEYQRVLNLFEAFFSHKTAHKIVSSSLVEQSIFWTDHDTGLWLKARPDGIYTEGNSVYLWDYKTSISAADDDFSRAICNYGYHVSAAHYIAGFQAATGQKAKKYYFIVQENQEPYSVRIIEADERMLAKGEEKRRELLNRIAVARAENYYPAYGDEIAKLDLPSWAYKSQEGDIFGGVA